MLLYLRSRLFSSLICSSFAKSFIIIQAMETVAIAKDAAKHTLQKEHNLCLLSVRQVVTVSSVISDVHVG